MPYYDNPRIFSVLLIIYISLVGLLGWLGWLVGSWLEAVLGKKNRKWIKYLFMAVVIPISMAVCIIPTGFVFHYVFYANLPESIWGMKDTTITDKSNILTKPARILR
jgi:hypothetical protein